MEAMFNTKNKNKGQVLVLVALSLVVFIGFAALAIDVAYFYHTKNQLQGAADAAALAGAAYVTCKDDTDPNFPNLSLARQEAWKFGCKNKASGENVYLVTNNPLNCDTPPDAADINSANVDNADIVIGHWTGSNFIRATGATGNVINAVKVTARRVSGSAYYGMGPIRTFFGGIFWKEPVNVSAVAIAQGCLGLAPISINEYWPGDDGLTGPPACKHPANSDPGRVPYGIHHVYPNSFVRPPCNPPFGASNCDNPENGNVLTTTFSAFKTQDCKTPPNTISVRNNGPLPVPCSGIEECKGRPVGMQTAGRVFAIVGGAAFPNDPGSNMHSLLNLDERIGYSQTTAGEQWYKVSGSEFESIPNAKADTYKGIIAGYIRNGKYPNVLPTSKEELYQSNYYEPMSTYASSRPFASISFVSGQGVVGQMVNANFYDNGSYSGGKYAPGNKIIVTVYDGVKGGIGNNERTTIVGFARVIIFGFGNRLNLDSNGYPSVSGPQNTMYGYIESANDLKQNFSDFFMPGPALLVQ